MRGEAAEGMRTVEDDAVRPATPGSAPGTAADTARAAEPRGVARSRSRLGRAGAIAAALGVGQAVLAVAALLGHGGARAWLPAGSAASGGALVLLGAWLVRAARRQDACAEMAAELRRVESALQADHEALELLRAWAEEPDREGA